MTPLICPLCRESFDLPQGMTLSHQDLPNGVLIQRAGEDLVVSLLVRDDCTEEARADMRATAQRLVRLLA